MEELFRHLAGSDEVVDADELADLLPNVFTRDKFQDFTEAADVLLRTSDKLVQISTKTVGFREKCP